MSFGHPGCLQLEKTEMASIDHTRTRPAGAKTHNHRSEIRDGMRIEWDVPIAMDDGLILRADIFRPLAEGRYPVILSYGPYGKGLAFQDGYPSAWQRMAEQHPDVAAGSSNLYQSWEVVDPEKWVPHDYACMRVDSRGCGCSPGFIDHFSPRETKDFYDCIEWAGGQSWSNGKVGLDGISYYAINQWHVASLQPPHLAAMCIWEGAPAFYRDVTHRARAPIWSKVKTPFLSAANWGGQPLHPRGNFEGFVRAAAKDKWLEVHGIEHWTHFYTDYGRKLQLQFFDHFLHGKKNGFEQRPRVLLQVRHIDKFVDRAENEWPLKRTKWTKFYLDPAGGALARERASKTAAKRSQVEFDALGDGVTFLSEPLTQETEITGPSAVKL